ncbi:MAG TPA: hypothetical protein VE046_10680, partial [Steroidobacteraceae bacterium]|nr:hypothetical protein [Steroidobacteraceae bacterium]
GYIALDAPRKRALAAGAVAVDWEYTPDQDAPPPYATQPAAAGAPVVSSHARPHNAATSASVAPAPTPVATAVPAPTPIATATPAPEPEPPKAAFVVCMAEGDPHTKYINPPIDGGNGNNSTWMKAYRAYLDPRYHYRGNIRCNRQPTLDAAQIFYDKMLEKARELPGNGGVPPKIVVTEWK